MRLLRSPLTISSFSYPILLIDLSKTYMKAQSEVRTFSHFQEVHTQLILSVAMEAPPTTNFTQEALPVETAASSKTPRNTERLIDTKSLGLEVVYNPLTAPGSKVARVDVE